ncbi:MAG: glutamine-hydrolyzing GMP synthase, partial [Clostridiales bacterium]|nr:glutamine-hydrolyzing GMP synthase [Clostridiales bacterium]
MKNETILVLDFGGQYKELIASRIRQLSVYSEIKPGSISADEIREISPIGLILTGGPKSVYGENAPKCDPAIFSLGIPVLGICYGMQLMCCTLGGKVVPGLGGGEYGRIRTKLQTEHELFAGLPEKALTLMSHGDIVKELPEGFCSTASTAKCKNAACVCTDRKLYGVQFHPEVRHTDRGTEVLQNFLYNVCKAKGDYSIDDYLESVLEEIRNKAGDNKILLALSGGVDSSVCAALIEKALPGKLTCVFVDHGLMRKNEGDKIETVFADKKLDFIRVNAADRFLEKLKGVTEPETKRKIIGKEFVAVFEEQAKKLGDIPFLAQGTIYPDIVESGGGATATIKSHHNVGGLPENIGFEGLIEPLRGLFKDEVRALGKKLGLPDELVNRQPFPGPGLAVRVIGEITPEKLHILREADSIVCEEIGKMKNPPSQYFAVLPGVRSVGVAGDERKYDDVIAVRAVNTSDFMTAEYAPLSHSLLSRISSRISNEVEGAGRVVYDISGKPPATVEWE